MIRLLQIEFFKLRYHKPSKILIGTYFLLLLSIALIASIKFDIGPIKIYLAEQGIFNFPYIWQFNTYIASIFKFFLLLVIVSMMANEYTNRTLKQNLIDGLSKRELVLSKFYVVIALSLISTIFVFVVSMVLGLAYSDYDAPSIIFSDLNYLVAYFVKLLCFFSFGLFLGILVKRSAFAIGAMLIWYFIENLIYGLLKWKFFKDTDIAENISQFFPLKSMSNLIHEPFSRLKAVKTVAQQLGEKYQIDYSVHWYQLAIVLIWTFLFVYLSYKLLQKRDL